MNIFVTGGSRGIGAAVVLEAVRQGHHVAFSYHQQREAAEAVVRAASDSNHDVRCRCYQLDVRDSGQVESVGDQVLEDFESIDGIVCNAATTADNLVVTMTDAEWQDVLQTNLTGSFYVARYFLPNFLSQRRGRILFLSSIGYGGASGQANYAASKAGLHGLSRTLAKEYGAKGITANVIAPGFIETDMSRDRMSDTNREFWIRHCPVRRTGEPAEVASLALFLLSPEAGFINGQVIPIDGGLDWAP